MTLIPLVGHGFPTQKAHLTGGVICSLIWPRTLSSPINLGLDTSTKVNCYGEGKNTYLLQVKFSPWQIPFHLAGGGPKPWSLKLSASGQTPVKQKL